MPGNANTRLKNRHHLIAATSGGGKSAWLKDKVKNAKRLIVWDPDEEYKAVRYRTRSEFVRALYAAINSGQGYKLALSVDAIPGNFDWFCRVVWAVADCRRQIVVVAEEIADVTTTAKALPAWGTLCRRGRKYGLIIYAVTQRPAECDKTIYSQAAYKWVGILENEADRKRLSSLIGASVADLGALNPLEYYLKSPGANPPKKGVVKIPK